MLTGVQAEAEVSLQETRALERRLSFGAVCAAITLFSGLVLVGGYRFPSYDESKYLAIGLNVFSGHGVRNVYGGFFPTHSPLWPVLMAAPQAWFGIDAYAWAHVLNTGAAALMIAAAAALAWRIRPAAGALTAGFALISPLIFSLSIRTGLDVPAAALALTYLLIGVEAVRRQRSSWGIAAGLVLAAGFLVKEVVVPLAPVPMLAAVAAGMPTRSAARIGGLILIVFLAATAWWWLLYAQETGTIWRLGAPAWVLAPLGAAVLIVGLVAIAAEPLARVLDTRFARIRPVWRKRPPPRLIAWFIAIAWMLLLALLFNRARELRGAGLLDPGQLRYHLARFDGDLRAFIVLGGVGAAIALAARRRGGLLRSPAIDVLWMATLVAVPFVLLVIGVGELPRHYLAQLVVLAAIASAGWLWLIGQLDVARPRGVLLTLTLVGGAAIIAVSARASLIAVAIAVAAALGALVVVVLAVRPKVRAALGALASDPRWPVMIGVLSVALGSALFTARVATARVLPGDPARAEAVATVTSWLRDNVPAGVPLAYGCCLANNVAVNLAGRNPANAIREYQDVVFDSRTPLGLRSIGVGSVQDWVAVFESPGNPKNFYGYGGLTLAAKLGLGPKMLVIVGTQGAPSITIAERAFTSDHGFQMLADWRRTSEGVTTRAFVLGFDVRRIHFGERVYFTERALARFVGQLERAGSDGRRIAARLVDRIVVADPGPLDADVSARLRRLAATPP